MKRCLVLELLEQMTQAVDQHYSGKIGTWEFMRRVTAIQEQIDKVVPNICNEHCENQEV